MPSYEVFAQAKGKMIHYSVQSDIHDAEQIAASVISPFITSPKVEVRKTHSHPTDYSKMTFNLVHKLTGLEVKDVFARVC